jgi:hypothetical protein
MLGMTHRATSLRKIFISLLIFFLTCITELSYASFWLAAFFLAVTWPQAWIAIVMGGDTGGFKVLFACVASLVVPFVMGSVFGVVVMMLRQKN